MERKIKKKEKSKQKSHFHLKILALKHKKRKQEDQNKKTQRGEFRNSGAFESSEILDRRRARGFMMYFELYKYTWMYTLNCPQYTGEQLCTQPIKFFCFSDFASD